MVSKRRFGSIYWAVLAAFVLAALISARNASAMTKSEACLLCGGVMVNTMCVGSDNICFDKALPPVPVVVPVKPAVPMAPKPAAPDVKAATPAAPAAGDALAAAVAAIATAANAAGREYGNDITAVYDLATLHAATLTDEQKTQLYQVIMAAFVRAHLAKEAAILVELQKVVDLLQKIAAKE